MKSAAKVQDMLEVSRKLSEVRGEIEQQQAEFATLSKQVETVALTLALRGRASGASRGTLAPPVRAASGVPRCAGWPDELCDDNDGRDS